MPLDLTDGYLGFLPCTWYPTDGSISVFLKTTTSQELYLEQTFSSDPIDRDVIDSLHAIFCTKLM